MINLTTIAELEHIIFAQILTGSKMSPLSFMYSEKET